MEIKELPAPAVGTLFDLIEEFGNAEQVLVAAEHDATMAAAREVIRGRGLSVATGFSTGEIRAFMAALTTGQEAPREAPGRALQIPLRYRGVELVTPASVAAAHGQGVEVHVWTVNETDEDEGAAGVGRRRHHHRLPRPPAGRGPAIRSALTRTPGLPCQDDPAYRPRLRRPA